LDALVAGARIELIRAGESRVYSVVVTCEVKAEDFLGVVTDTYVAEDTYLDSLTLVTDHPSDAGKRVYVVADFEDEWLLTSRCPAGLEYDPPG
jgi:sortase (surface protein transpeptidase)